MSRERIVEFKGALSALLKHILILFEKPAKIASLLPFLLLFRLGQAAEEAQKLIFSVTEEGIVEAVGVQR